LHCLLQELCRISLYKNGQTDEHKIFMLKHETQPISNIKNVTDDSCKIHHLCWMWVCEDKATISLTSKKEKQH